MWDAYVVCDANGRIVDSNRAAAKFLGGDDELVGAHVHDVLPEVGDAIDGGGTFDQFREEVTRPVDGEPRYFDANTSTLDAVDGALVVLRDITDQRQAERRFQTLIERSSDIITVLDADGVVDYVSPTVERTLGLPSSASSARSSSTSSIPTTRTRFAQCSTTPSSKPARSSASSTASRTPTAPGTCTKRSVGASSTTRASRAWS